MRLIFLRARVKLEDIFMEERATTEPERVKEHEGQSMVWLRCTARSDSGKETQMKMIMKDLTCHVMTFELDL